jgi:hypothetical protein
MRKYESTPLPPPSFEKRRERVEFAKIIRSYTHLMLVRWSKKLIGTAVMMRAGNRLFAITVEHNVNEETKLLFPLGDSDKPTSQILKTHKHPSLDIAILELENRPDILACDIAQLAVNLPSLPAKNDDPASVPLVWVAGYPAELAKPTDTGLSAPLEAFGTNIIEVSPETFAVYYPTDAYGVYVDSTFAISPLANEPHGILESRSRS